MAAAAASISPIDESLKKILGENSETTGTQTPLNYDATTAFRPIGGDVINISGAPGTGVSVADQWSQKQQQLEFEYQKQKGADAQALALLESGRAAAQLGLQKTADLRSAAAAAQQLAQGKQSMAATTQQMALAQAAEQRAAEKVLNDYADAHGGLSRSQVTSQNAAAVAANQRQNAWLNGAALSPASAAAYNQRSAQQKLNPLTAYQQGILARENANVSPSGPYFNPSFRSKV